MHSTLRRAAALAACVLMLVTATACPARAQSSLSAGIDGGVVDAATGLPLGGARVAVIGHAMVHVDTARDGSFHILDLPPGAYRLRVDRGGYQPAESAPLELAESRRAGVTLALQRTASAGGLGVIGSTATSAVAALQRSSTLSVGLSSESLAEAGITRVGDALRTLPGINNAITGDTAALGDDIPLALRGIGTLETTTTLDGHPVAQGFPGGYNFQLSPLAGLRDVVVTYGSGSNLFGSSAIGGMIDFQTLEPTAAPSLTALQGFGSFDTLTSLVRATGSAGKLGYAFAYGATGVDGPFRHATFYQPGAAFDQSARGSARGGVYDDDSSANSHSGLLKLRFAPDARSQITFTALLSSYWENKTGNGDGDYLGSVPALAFGNQLLGNYSPAAFPGSAPCPAGTFVASNANGVPNDAVPCQTPAQYAAFNTGYQGAGPASQSFGFADEHIAYQRTSANTSFRFDAFADRYRDVIDRSGALPYDAVPGDGNGSFFIDQLEHEAGASLSYDVSGRNNALGVGYGYLNLAYALRQQFPANGSVSAGTPIVHETNVTLRDTYHAAGSPLTVFGNAVLRRAGATGTTSLDPRLSVVLKATRSDLVRLSAGATTSEPSGDQLGQPFGQANLGGAGGGAPIDCGGINPIGTAPSSVLRPERGVDEELAFGHGFGGDSQVQLAFYSEHVYDKLFSATVPLSLSGTGFIDPAYLTQQTAIVAAKCGATVAPSLLGVSGTFNVGALRARGVTLSGRQRFDRRTYLDYDWTTDSTAITSVPLGILRGTPTLIQGAQLAHLPLHTYDLALDRLVGRGLDLRYTLHGVSENNTKALPAYTYSDLRLAATTPHGVFAIAVGNLFNQNADIRGLRYEGVPLALNAYASAMPNAYAPSIGANATERFGLPYRRIFFTYQLRIQ